MNSMPKQMLFPEEGFPDEKLTSLLGEAPFWPENLRFLENDQRENPEKRSSARELRQAGFFNDAGSILRLESDCRILRRRNSERQMGLAQMRSARNAGTLVNKQELRDKRRQLLLDCQEGRFEIRKDQISIEVYRRRLSSIPGLSLHLDRVEVPADSWFRQVSQMVTKSPHPSPAELTHAKVVLDVIEEVQDLRSVKLIRGAILSYCKDHPDTIVAELLKREPSYIDKLFDDLREGGDTAAAIRIVAEYKGRGEGTIQTAWNHAQKAARRVWTSKRPQS
jgi:hypothetical protein